MAYSYSDYPARARKLADAGDNLLEAISDPTAEQSIVVVDLETSASGIAPADLQRRFEPAPNVVSQPPSPEDILSGILLEFQSANALISAGIALDEHGSGSDTQFLKDAVSQLRETGADLSKHIQKAAVSGFAPTEAPSANLDTALTLFRTSATRTLDSIQAGTEGVIDSAFKKLKEQDKSKVAQAIDNLGKTFEVVKTAGNLIKQGLAKLKAVLAALSEMFGDEALSQIKAKVKEIWEKYTKENPLVATLIGIPDAKHRVNAFADAPGRQIQELDGLSRELALLEDKYQGKRQILDGLVSAVVLAMGVVGFLNVVGLWAASPWVALVAGGAYAAIIGSALLVGLNYTGTRRWAGWTRGVCEIIPSPVKAV